MDDATTQSWRKDCLESPLITYSGLKLFMKPSTLRVYACREWDCTVCTAVDLRSRPGQIHVVLAQVASVASGVSRAEGVGWEGRRDVGDERG